MLAIPKNQLTFWLDGNSSYYGTNAIDLNSFVPTKEMTPCNS